MVYCSGQRANQPSETGHQRGLWIFHDSPTLIGFQVSIPALWYFLRSNNPPQQSCQYPAIASRMDSEQPEYPETVFRLTAKAVALLIMAKACQVIMMLFVVFICLCCGPSSSSTTSCVTSYYYFFFIIHFLLLLPPLIALVAVCSLSF